MKQFLKKHKYGLLLIIPGAILGYLYWYHIGCTSGSCPITSVWYNSSIYGAILGYLAGDFADGRIKKYKSEKQQPVEGPEST